MLDLLLMAAVQIQTIRLPPIPPTGVPTIKVAPDLVVKEIRIQDNWTMHVLVANIGTGAVVERFPVRGSVEIGGHSADIETVYADPLPAGGQVWVKLRSGFAVPMTTASSATAGADLYPEPKSQSGSLVPWPTIGAPSHLPGMKPGCTNITGCVTEIDETNNSYTVAGVPRGTPERLNAPELAPIMVPERG